MPLLITSAAAPFLTNSAIELPAVYAIILKVAYDTDEAKITFNVGYYVNEAARVARAAPLVITGLPVGFFQLATAEQADAVGIFTFLEQVLTAQLTNLLGADVTIENVP